MECLIRLCNAHICLFKLSAMHLINGFRKALYRHKFFSNLLFYCFVIGEFKSIIFEMTDRQKSEIVQITCKQHGTPNMVNTRFK